MVYKCHNCNGEVIYHEGYNHGWGHVIATGCVKPAVNIDDWKRYLQEKRVNRREAKMEYTKGEWRKVGAEILDKDNRTLAIISDGSFEEKVANAHLIASAPDLYEALNAIVTEPNFGIPGRLAVLAGNALAKAECK